MRVGDPIELRWSGTVLGPAHIAEIPETRVVVIKADPRVLPSGTMVTPRDRLEPKPDGGWVLELP